MPDFSTFRQHHQFAIGSLRLGILAILLSDPIISSFVVASSFHVFTSQVFGLLGIDSAARAADSDREAAIPFVLIRVSAESVCGLLFRQNLTFVIVLNFFFISSELVPPAVPPAHRQPRDHWNIGGHGDGADGLQEPPGAVAGEALPAAQLCPPRGHSLHRRPDGALLSAPPQRPVPGGHHTEDLLRVRKIKL